MSDDEASGKGAPTRREPPPFLVGEVTAVTDVSPRLMRITLAGDPLRGLEPPQPAGSVRLLVPSEGTSDLVIPAWTGNEFLLPDGSRPALRTFTPLRFEPDRGQLDIEIVRHPGGAVSSWVEQVGPGDPAAISGPARGYTIDAEADGFVLVGDETAIPAIGQLIEALPSDAAVTAHVEVIADDAIVSLPHHAKLTVTWHVREAGERPGAALVRAVADLPSVDESDRVWAAGEAASMQAIRKHLFETRGLSRRQATVRGYWKPARASRDRARSG